jgi:hypothetical protein
LREAVDALKLEDGRPARWAWLMGGTSDVALYLRIQSPVRSKDEKRDDNRLIVVLQPEDSASTELSLDLAATENWLSAVQSLIDEEANSPTS